MLHAFILNVIILLSDGIAESGTVLLALCGVAWWIIGRAGSGSSRDA